MKNKVNINLYDAGPSIKKIRLILDVREDGVIEVWNGNHKIKYASSIAYDRVYDTLKEDEPTIAIDIANALNAHRKMSRFLFCGHETNEVKIFNSLTV